MKDGRLLQQPQTEKELVGVTAHCVNVQPHVLAVLFEHLPEVHAERLKDQTEVIAVVEGGEQSQTVVLVLGVGGVQLHQQLALLQAGFVPKGKKGKFLISK